MIFQSPIISLGKFLYDAINEASDDMKSGNLDELRTEE